MVKERQKNNKKENLVDVMESKREDVRTNKFEEERASLRKKMIRVSTAVRYSK